jgi:hypothetical protein
MPKLTEETRRMHRIERVKSNWESAEINEYGLPVLGWWVFAKDTPAQMIPDMLKQATFLTSDGVPICVAVPVEEYFSHVKSNPKGEMVRLNGKLFREV